IATIIRNILFFMGTKPPPSYDRPRSGPRESPGRGRKRPDEFNYEISPKSSRGFHRAGGKCPLRGTGAAGIAQFMSTGARPSPKIGVKAGTSSGRAVRRSNGRNFLSRFSGSYVFILRVIDE